MPVKIAASPPLSKDLHEQLDRIEDLLTSMHYIVDVQLEGMAELKAQMRLLSEPLRVH